MFRGQCGRGGGVDDKKDDGYRSRGRGTEVNTTSYSCHNPFGNNLSLPGNLYNYGVLGRANRRISIKEDTTRIMTELILKECMEKAQAESSLAKSNTDNYMNIELRKEFLKELRSYAYHGMFDEDVVNHIAKVLEILNLIKIPNVDAYRLRMKVFPLLLADDSR
ncbi:hypothetical protein Tco_1240032 [Tanacetum coccineum]